MEIRELFLKMAEIKEKTGITLVSDLCQQREIAEAADVIGDDDTILRTDYSSETIIVCAKPGVAALLRSKHRSKRVLCPYAFNGDEKTVRLAAELIAEHRDFVPICTTNVPIGVMSMCRAVLTEDGAKRVVGGALDNALLFSSERLGAFVKLHDVSRSVMLARVAYDDEESISSCDLASLLAMHGNVPIISSCKCGDDILDISSFIGTYRDILKYVNNSGDDEFIVCADHDFVRYLSYENEKKRFFAPPMKKAYNASLTDVISIATNGRGYEACDIGDIQLFI